MATAIGGVVMLVGVVYYYLLPFLVAAIQPLEVNISLLNESGAPVVIERVIFEGKALKEGVRVEGRSLGDSWSKTITIGYDEWSRRGRLEIILKRPGRGESEKHAIRLQPKFGANWCFYDIHIRARSVDAELIKCIFF
ncbi:hypothetical protein [Shumkonia mesophila]|uniref:hypothetical protein n=1 Tax=Shumkonia mesophila TaxID=2838854 RepID=UPI0029345132|nr:hypothetical protein [Shumkonia mesophila]